MEADYKAGVFIGKGHNPWLNFAVHLLDDNMQSV